MKKTKRLLLLLVLSVALVLAFAVPAFAQTILSYDGYCYNYFDGTQSNTVPAGWNYIEGHQIHVVGSTCNVRYSLIDGSGSYAYGEMYGEYGRLGLLDYFTIDFTITGSHANTHIRVQNLNYNGTTSRIHADGALVHF
jgi:hypothetical protein